MKYIAIIAAMAASPAGATGLVEVGLDDPEVSAPYCTILFGLLPCHKGGKDAGSRGHNPPDRAGGGQDGTTPDGGGGVDHGVDRDHPRGTRGPDSGGGDNGSDNGDRSACEAGRADTGGSENVTSRPGNPGNDKNVGRAGEKKDRGMAERGDVGSRGKSN